MKIQIIVFTLACFFMGLDSDAQNKTITQIGGYVFSELEQRPLSAVKVILVDRGIETRTDDNGEFRFNGSFAAGEKLSLVFFRDCCQTKAPLVRVADDGDLGHFTLAQAPLYQLTIMVKSTCERVDLVNGAEVSFGQKVKKTDNHGKVTFNITDDLQRRGITPLMITVKKEGFADTALEFHYSAGKRLVEAPIRNLDPEYCVIDKGCGGMFRPIESYFGLVDTAKLEKGKRYSLLKGNLMAEVLSVDRTGASLYIRYPKSSQVDELIRLSKVGHQQISFRFDPQDIYFDLSYSDYDNTLLIKLNEEVTMSHFKKPIGHVIK